jgi:hypothetical protein
MATLTASDRAALAHVITEDPDAYVARIEATFPNAAQVIADKIAVCKAQLAKSPDKRTRLERDTAEAEAMKPSALAVELGNARYYAQVQQDLAAAKALKLDMAAQHLTDELARLAPKE